MNKRMFYSWLLIYNSAFAILLAQHEPYRGHLLFYLVFILGFPAGVVGTIVLISLFLAISTYGIYDMKAAGPLLYLCLLWFFSFYFQYKFLKKRLLQKTN